jgi:PAS domain-containing protein
VRLAGVLGAMGDAHVALDRDWRVVVMNRAAERINRRPAADFLGRDHWEAWPAAVGTHLEREYRRAMAERVVVRLRPTTTSPGSSTRGSSWTWCPRPTAGSGSSFAT